ncbi:MAG: hypothetical protein ACLPIC_16895 [Rhodoblastus sp.]|uniref:hypothetical protein n=1 Tax=Rhodoblastus sp. TaxID=1962975 RepID=UPI003F9827AF
MRYWELFESAALDNGPATALAIHAMTDLPLVALMVGKRGPKSVAHVMVKSSDDAFIDAEGLRPLVEILHQAGVDASDQVGWEVREISPKELLNWSNGKRLPFITKSAVPAAKARAHEVLARLGIPAR